MRGRAGGIPWLTELLLFGGDGAKEAAAAAIAELAAVGPAVRQEIEEAGKSLTCAILVGPVAVRCYLPVACFRG